VEALQAELSGGAPADFAADLGALVAELHAALATASSRWPEPVSTVEASASGDSLDTALAAVGPGEDADWLAAHAGRLRAELAGAAVATPALRIHGDLHVGQVLRWRDGYAITDFDGNPTVTDAPPHEPAARDVAQMCTSLGHVGQIANRLTEGAHLARILDWAQQSRLEFLAAYRAGLADRGLGALFDERLLRRFEIEQECRELIYAARFLPRWRYAPLGVLRVWYPE
jgi:maltokinase